MMVVHAMDHRRHFQPFLPFGRNCGKPIIATIAASGGEKQKNMCTFARNVVGEGKQPGGYPEIQYRTAQAAVRGDP
jgi:hypothetical protein